MKLTLRSEYALLALVYLARQESEDYVAVKTVAQAQTIPPKFLETIMLTLKRANYLQSHKGQHGGYRLAKPAQSITFAEIIRLFDGAIAPTGSVSEYFYESTPIEKEQGLVRVFRKVRDYVAHQMETTTLADVV